MKVKKLIELLQKCDPEAFVRIGLPEVNREYVEQLEDRPACLLYFFLEQRSECSYTGFPSLPAMEEVVIYASLDTRIIHSDDAEILQEVAENMVAPDFHPEAN